MYTGKHYFLISTASLILLREEMRTVDMSGSVDSYNFEHILCLKVLFLHKICIWWNFMKTSCTCSSTSYRRERLHFQQVGNIKNVEYLVINHCWYMYNIIIKLSIIINCMMIFLFYYFSVGKLYFFFANR